MWDSESHTTPSSPAQDEGAQAWSLAVRLALMGPNTACASHLVFTCSPTVLSRPDPGRRAMSSAVNQRIFTRPVVSGPAAES